MFPSTTVQSANESIFKLSSQPPTPVPLHAANQTLPMYQITITLMTKHSSYFANVHLQKMQLLMHSKMIKGKISAGKLPINNG
jgi:hypothetical protein